MRVTWRGRATPAATFIALMVHDTYRAAIGAARLGVQAGSDAIKFRDRDGAIRLARPGDEIEVTPEGWVLHSAAQDATGEEGDRGR